MAPIRFIGVMFAVAALAAALIAAFNLAVDPYLFFNRPRVQGFNALKPAVLTREPFMKAYQAARVAPETVILGSSRPDIGMDPADAAWPSSLQPVYNLSLVGAGLDTNLRYLRGLLQAREAGPLPRHLVVGLDFESFLYRPSSREAADAAGAPNKERDPADVFAALVRWNHGAIPATLLKDLAAGTVTLDALQDSVLTLAGNRADRASDLEPNGRLSEAQLRQWTLADGAWALFAQKNAYTVARYAAPKLVLSDTPTGPIREFEQLDALTDLARRHGMKVHLVIQPAHASHFETLDSLQYWPDYERWKRALAAHAAASRQAGSDVSVWDFGGFETHALESVPESGDRRRSLTWFWDPVHYSRALGAVIIGVITQPDPGLSVAYLLTPENVEARLARVRQDRDAYRRLHPNVTRRAP